MGREGVITGPEFELNEVAFQSRKRIIGNQILGVGLAADVARGNRRQIIKGRIIDREIANRLDFKHSDFWISRFVLERSYLHKTLQKILII